MEKRREEAELRPRARCVRRRKRRARSAESGVDQRQEHRDREWHQREEQWVPDDAEERKAAERNDHEDPLRGSGQRPEAARRRLVERLKWRAAPWAVIDPAATEELGQALAIEAARPRQMPGRVVLPRPLPLQHRLRPAVPALLLPVRAHRAPRVMPDDSRRTEPERPFPLLQPPTHVHVVAGRAKLRIEPPDRLEGLLAKRHVASGDVFGLTIAEQDMNRSARGTRDAFGCTPVTRGRDVRAAHANMCRAQKSVREICEPVRIGVGVIVDVRDDLAPGCPEAGVPRAGEAAVLGLDQPAAVSARDGGGGVRRALVHNDDPGGGAGPPFQGLEAIADGARAVVRADDHGDRGPAEIRREGYLAESVSYGGERGLRRAVSAREAEGPVLDVLRVPVPLIGPRGNEGTGASCGEGRPDLPIERRCLVGLAIAKAVEPELAHEERAVPGEVLQAVEVRIEPRP